MRSDLVRKKALKGKSGRRKKIINDQKQVVPLRM
jgi:hypothetical protein